MEPRQGLEDDWPFDVGVKAMGHSNEQLALAASDGDSSTTACLQVKLTSCQSLIWTQLGSEMQ